MSNCLNPQPKDAELMVGMNGLDGNSSNSKSAGRMAGMPTFLWLVALSVLIIPAFIMAAWATTVANDAWNKVDNIYGSSMLGSSVLLVNNPRPAIESGFKVAGHLYADTGYWSLNDPGMLFQRSDHGSVAYDADHILLFGGLSNDASGNATVLTSVVKYNLYLNVTETMASMPSPRYRFGYALLGYKLYVFSGFDRFDCGPTAVCDYPTQLATTMVYDILLNTWAELPASANLHTPRVDGTGAAANGKVYCFGGYDNNWTPTTSSEVFDPATGVWSVITPMSVARGDLKAVSVNDKIYVMGGSSTDPKLFPGIDCMTVPMGTCAVFFNTTEIYDAKAGTWSRGADMTRRRGDFGAETLANNRIIVAGGENGNIIRTGLAVPWVEEYIVADDIWVPKAPLPQARFRFDIARVGDLAYAFGGAPSCATDTSNDCVNKGLSTIFGYVDDPSQPNIYAVMR